MDVLLTQIKKLMKNCSYYQSKSYINAKSIKEMPIVDRYDVIKNYNQFFNDRKPLIFTQTSGSNGTPLRIPWNYNDYIKSLTCLWRLRAKYGIFPTTFQLTCHSEVDSFGNRIDNPVIVFSNSISLSKLCYTEDILQDYLRKIEIFKPTWIYGQPSFVYFIAQYISNKKPELLRSFNYIELVGELLPQDVKMWLEEMFPNATIINMYGMQEFNGIMYEENRVMKEIENNVFVEIIDEDGNDCGIDKEGDIVVTGLHNSAFPLIRYNTKDRGKRIFIDGREGYAITVGRSNDQFSWNGGTYDGSLFFTVINEYSKRKEANICRFQVIYDEDIFTFILWNMCSIPNDLIIECELDSIIMDLIGVHLPLKVQLVSSADEFIKCGNKIKYFINKNNTK